MMAPFKAAHKDGVGRATTEGLRHRLLLVDDDRHLLVVLSDFLKFEGFDVTTAESGEQALRKMDSQMPDLIILDIGMPGMGGLGLLRLLRGSGVVHRIPILVLTARSNMADFFENSEVEGFLAKPCAPESMVHAIRRIITPAGEGGVGMLPHGEGPLVVLCESDPVLGEALCNALRVSGFSVLSTQSGPEALAAGLRHSARAYVSNFVLEGMNGDVLARDLRHSPGFKGVPIILYDYTGGARPIEDRRVAEGLVTRFVHAQTPHEIVQALRSLVS